MIQYDVNGEPIPDRIRRGGLITIAEGSHAGFSHMASGPMRLLGNPDNLGCQSLMANLDLEPGDNPFTELGGPEDGIVDASGTPLPCEIQFDEAMHPGRQHMLTTLAVRAFFSSHFAADPDERNEHARFLEKTLPSEVAEVEFASARRS